LKSVHIQALFETGCLGLDAFGATDWVELKSEAYPDERLIACRNPQLAAYRSQQREALLCATEEELNGVLKATQRQCKPLQGQDKIGVRVGRVINRFKMAKHFQWTIGKESFSYQRNHDSITREARLDGLYVLRTSVPSTTFDAPRVVQTYKSLSHVESAFRCMKAFDLNVRPIFHRLTPRVKAHVFLCMLAYYVEWHMRQALAPILFSEDNPSQAEALRTSVVQRAQRSDSAKQKAGRRQTPSGEPIHSFRSLLADLATLTQNTIQPTNQEVPSFEKTTLPTPIQQVAFDLLNVSV
ncbi:MAG: transposase, partial [Okeania sp. SIO3C4]|nr:transposase [Okeania sp. SIO3C4]